MMRQTPTLRRGATLVAAATLTLLLSGCFGPGPARHDNRGPAAPGGGSQGNQSDTSQPVENSSGDRESAVQDAVLDVSDAFIAVDASVATSGLTRELTVSIVTASEALSAGELDGVLRATLESLSFEPAGVTVRVETGSGSILKLKDAAAQLALSGVTRVNAAGSFWIQYQTLAEHYG